MTNRYPLWKYLILAVVLVVGVIYALPNLFGSDPALQISTESGDPPAETVQQRVVDRIEGMGLAVKGTEVREGRFLVRLNNTEAQLAAKDELDVSLGPKYTVALNLAQSTPDWLRALGARPMFLGLDLRGGVHFLMEVDTDAAIQQHMDRYTNEFRKALREARVRYTDISEDGTSLRLGFDAAQEREQAFQVLSDDYRELEFTSDESDGQFWMRAKLPEKQVQEIVDFAVEQNITTLRNRVNELGVAEPVIQRQGRSRIVVQLPGVQDTARAKDILGATATLEFRPVDMDNFPYQGGADGPVPPGSEVYPRQDGGYVMLEDNAILTGEYITDAQSGLDQRTGQPEVTIRLNAAGGDLMTRFSAQHVNDYMAVLFIETQTVTQRVNGEVQRRQQTDRKVISVAQIQEQLGSRFRITGLGNPREARNLALLLRAGSLAAPLQIVEERTIGPSLGQENIDQGLAAVVVGFLLVVAFMALYYKVFGLIADVALLLNLVLIVAALSLLQATLTLPGIAGIVLTVGMAVDANVLIFERVREEIRAGASARTAIDSGYGKAFSTIADANITTLIAAIVLFAFGTGPVKGFAVTLSIGIVTSMFTAIMGTRGLVNLIYGARRKARLSI
ncbi:protein translocase subunit SecD [Arhodomonas aquaeolei]|uniref:protein translocase subunit SecD n=1 Tax=Arhodomonas aquaeolei TaxID=2369 RepID=UPI000360B35D|nr:protein translocase subunit SecD [Arhodomonas aquaeolei]